MPLIETAIDDAIGTITLNHPKKRNALSASLIDEILKALTAFQEQRIRIVVLRAQPGVTVWSAGHDVSELPPAHQDPLGWGDPLRRLIRAVQDCPAPTVALIEGGVWGGACELTFACDLVIAADNATFALTPAKLGVPYNLSGLLTFMNSAGLHVVKEMAFTGQPIDAHRAEHLGMINRVVSRDDLDRCAHDMARQILENSSLSISVMKEEINTLAHAHDLSPLAFERIQALRRTVYNSHDYQEGIRAFLEKRKPRFTGE